MSCKHYEPLLALHAGGDLPVAEAAEVEAHLLQCGECSAELAGYRGAREALLAARPAQSAPVGLWSELDARLEAVDAATRHRRGWLRSWGLPSTLATAAALLIAIRFLPGGGVEGPAQPGVSGSPVAQEQAEDDDPNLRPASMDELDQALFAPYLGEGDEAEGALAVPAASRERDF